MSERRRELQAENAALKADVERLRSAASQESHEVEQVLGKALGYPQYTDDQKNFPGSTEAHGVCVGEHVPGSIAMEAAKRIRALTAEVERLNGFARQLQQDKREACLEIDMLRQQADEIKDLVKKSLIWVPWSLMRKMESWLKSQEVPHE